MKYEESLIIILLLKYLKIKTLKVNRAFIGIGEFCSLIVFMSMTRPINKSMTMFISTSLSIYHYNYIYD